MNLSPYPLHVDTLTAANSINQEGKPFSSGKKTTRLQFTDDSRFFVAAKIIGENTKWTEKLTLFFEKALGRYVEIKGENDTRLLININSVASRLHLTKDQIKTAAKQDKLLDVLKNRIENIQDVFSKYDEILKQYDIQRNRFTSDTLTSKKGIKTSLSPSVLMKVIKAALSTEISPLSAKEQQLSIQGRFFLINLDQKGQMRLFHISQQLGKGSFGTAYLAFDVIKGKEKVLKLARGYRSAGEEAKLDIKNEFEQLTKIHAQGNIWGIQAKPKKVIDIVPHRDVLETGYGYLGARYEGDYSKDIYKTPSTLFKERLFEFHQLLSGLKSLEEKNILHGDLKPQNILVRKDSEGTKLVHIADFGGAQDARTFKFSRKAYTPNYLPRLDLQASEQYAYQNRKNKSVEIEKKLVEVEKQSDVFAMGAILYEALTNGKAPYEFDDDGHPILKKYAQIKDSKVPIEIKQLVQDMLNSDYKNRPSASAAFDRLNLYIQEKHPDLQNQIQAKITNRYIS